MKHFSRFSRLFLLLSVVATGLSGCSTELDPNDDYQETMVIYSVLNPTQRIHYTKINKAFLNNNADARNIAENIPDSTTYGDFLNVRLQKLKVTNGDTTVVLPEYPMVRIDTTGKATGDFFSGRQILYRTQPGNPGTLDESALYRVVSTNTRTGLTAYGTTDLVRENANTSRPFCVFRVSSGGGTCLDLTTTHIYDPHKDHAIIFRVPGNAFIYNLKMTVKYTETVGSNSQQKQVSWYIRNNFLKDNIPTGPSPEIQETVAGMLFYENLKSFIPTKGQDPGVGRTIDDIALTITAGSKTLATNFQVNNSFSVFSQTRPEFSNVTNGTGLVGSRLDKTVHLRLSVEALNVLRNDPKYTELRFQ